MFFYIKNYVLVQSNNFLRRREDPKITRIKFEEYGRRMKHYNPFLRKAISPSTFKKFSHFENFHESL